MMWSDMFFRLAGKNLKGYRDYDMRVEFTDEIVQTVQNSLDREVSTEYIVELVMDKLKALDQVAYVRFASVYREFKDVETFMEELRGLQTDAAQGEQA